MLLACAANKRIYERENKTFKWHTVLLFWFSSQHLKSVDNDICWVPLPGVFSRVKSCWVVHTDTLVFCGQLRVVIALVRHVIDCPITPVQHSVLKEGFSGLVPTPGAPIKVPGRVASLEQESNKAQIALVCVLFHFELQVKDFLVETNGAARAALLVEVPGPLEVEGREFVADKFESKGHLDHPEFDRHAGEP